ncbi:MAG TPA: PAS domain S-box protein [Burkholderiaceae bacterium]|nr:PAS domain S-box protein [Burkholderiaceae bacterium]
MSSHEEPAHGEPDMRQRAEARLTSRVRPRIDTSDPAWTERVVHELGVHQIELEMQNEELRAAHAALELSRDRYADLYETAPVAYVTLQFDGRIVELNRRAIELLQTSRTEALRKRMQDFIAHEDFAPYRSRLAALARKAGAPQQLELRLRLPHGGPRWVSLHMALVTSAVNGAQYRLGMLDVDERVRSQEGATRMAALVASAQDAIVGRDGDGIVTSWNDAAARLFGHSAEAMIGGRLDAIVPPKQHDEQAALEQDLDSGRRSHSLDTVRRRADGTLVPVSITLSPIRDAHDRWAGSAMIARDISERERADFALRQRLRQLDVLSQAGQALIMSEPDAALCCRLFEEAALAAGCELQLHYGVDSAGDLVLLSASGLSLQQQSVVAAPPTAGTPWSMAAAQRQPVVLNDLQSSELPQAAWLRAAGARCCVAFPLLAPGRLYGVAAFASLTLDQLREGDLQVIHTVCDQVSAMLERSRLLHELHASESALRRADRAKDDFIATLAHELRNPLAPIRNAVGIMRHGDRTTPQQLAWCREIIERQVVQMTRLLEDLLDVSRVTRNKIELRRERLDLMLAIEQALEATRPLIESREQQLVLELPDEPVVLYGDLTRLTQVFVNLLQNAAKYTDVGGQITLNVSATDGRVRVGVRDNGIGIESQHLARVFEMFSQLAPALERSGGGLGIGLALTRGLVELHGGCVDAYSAGIGRGSEFVVTLPVAPQPRPAEAPSADAADAQASAPARRLLVVDDNSDAAQTLTTLLSMHGQDVRAAFSAEGAMRIAQDWQPDAAVLDIGLPDFDGYELCRRIRAQPWGQQPILIACTGWGQREDIDRARDAGFDFHLVKPVDPDAVLHVLSQSRAPRQPPPG